MKSTQTTSKSCKQIKNSWSADDLIAQKRSWGPPDDDIPGVLSTTDGGNAEETAGIQCIDFSPYVEYDMNFCCVRRHRYRRNGGRY